MRVKRYVVDSMPDALQKIRSDLGKDAVILNTKEIRSGGFLGFFGKKKIEVVAATDTPAGGVTADSKKDRRAPQQPVPRMSSSAAAKAYGKPSNLAVIDEPMPFVPDVLSPEPVIPTKLESETPVIPNIPVRPPAAEASQSSKEEAKSKEDILLEELRQMKDMMTKFARGVQPDTRPEALVELESRLLEQELMPALTARIVDSISEQLSDYGTELSRSEVFAAARRQLESIIRLESTNHVTFDTNVVHFVGPTGVGKTTTIAKLAAEQVLKHRRRVGFITSDTYRIAAIEQLKTYATILNIPIEVVFSPQDLKKAFAQLADRDLIFMDTAGRNYRNEMYVSELNALLQKKEKSETFLVMSMTTKYKDMKAITSNFMNFRIDKVLFTKMDETDSFGSIANLLDEFHLELSYLTNGQNVPEDIALADPKQIIDHILGESEHE